MKKKILKIFQTVQENIWNSFPEFFSRKWLVFRRIRGLTVIILRLSIFSIFLEMMRIFKFKFFFPKKMKKLFSKIFLRFFLESIFQKNLHSMIKILILSINVCCFDPKFEIKWRDLKIQRIKTLFKLIFKEVLFGRNLLKWRIERFQNRLMKYFPFNWNLSSWVSSNQIN